MDPILIAEGQRSPRWCFFKRLKLALPDGTVYLDRLRIIQTPKFGIYLHDILGPDPDPDPHDHPWDFWSLVIRGGYCEEFYESAIVDRWSEIIPYTLRCWKHWSIHRMDASGVAHRICVVKPRTRTLVFVGARRRNWGFWTKQGWMSWQQYEAQPGSKQVTE